MKFIWRWIRNRIQNCDDHPVMIGSTMSAKVSRSEDVESETGINITVRQAIGGRIVTFRHFDHKTDRTVWRNYVIPEDLDFERELGKMITLESMRG